MSIDLKLYRIFRQASRSKFSSRRDLATHIAGLELDEFSYRRRGKKEHANWGAIVSYISLLVALQMLDENLKPFVAARQTKLDGFKTALAAKALQFAEANRFGMSLMDLAITHQISQRPAILPTPFNIFEHLEPTCSYRSFYRIIRLKCLESEQNGIRVRNRPIVATTNTIVLGGVN